MMVVSHCMFLQVAQLEKIAQRNVYRRGKSYQNRDEGPMVEPCGQVQIAEGGKYYAVAIRATHNTAEMQALIEALFWLNSCVEQKGLASFIKLMITVDS